jgi:3'(2'), 5'-bisphosphate nucleotidase
MPTPTRQERLIAELAVQRASVLTKKVLSAVNKGELCKTDSSPVTIADFAAQALIISALHKAFENDTFVSEEDTDALRKDEQLKQRVWELVSSTHLDAAESEAMLASPELFDLEKLATECSGPTYRIVADQVTGREVSWPPYDSMQEPASGKQDNCTIVQ